jgi:hypothetical protein
MSAAQGRFTGPDPLLNSGRPWLPQSWNRYAYTLNNPLRFIDPDGLYEWARDCAAGDEACQRERDWFRKALDRAHEAAAKFKPRSEERKALERALARYGEENQRTGVLVAFGRVERGLAQTEGNPAVATVTFEVDEIKRAVESRKKPGWDLDLGVEAAGLSVHEGIHLADMKYSGLPGIGYAESLATERNAFGAQSYINEAFNRPSLYLLWNPSWAQVDRERLRQAAVEKAAERAVRAEWQTPWEAR